MPETVNPNATTTDLIPFYFHGGSSYGGGEVAWFPTRSDAQAEYNARKRHVSGYWPLWGRDGDWHQIADREEALQMETNGGKADRFALIDYTVN